MRYRLIASLCLATAGATAADTVDLRVVQMGEPERGVPSRLAISMDGRTDDDAVWEPWPPTDADGKATIDVEACTSRSVVRARPKAFYYQRVFTSCRNGPHILRSQRQLIADALQPGNPDRPPWADTLLAALAPSSDQVAALGEEGMALHGEMVAALNAAEFDRAGRLAGRLTALADEKGSDLTRAFSLLAYDASLRGLGLDPADSDAPLIARADSDTGFRLTQAGTRQYARTFVTPREEPMFARDFDDDVTTDVASETRTTPMPADRAPAGQPRVVTTAETSGPSVQVTQGTPTVSMTAMTAGDLKGVTVYDTSGMDIGEIEQLVATDSGVASVISVGGFLGLGEKPVAIDLDALRPAGNGVIVGRMSGAEIEAMPEYDYTGEPVADDAKLRELWKTGE